jgi:hypothetical protein
MKLRVLAIAITIAMPIALASCAGNSQEATTTESEMNTSAAMPAPVILTPEELAANSPITIAMYRPLVINVASNAASWTEGSTADDTIARFTPGRNDGSATFNPGFTPLNPGATTATIKDPENSENIVFDIVVEAG